jgi:hypothetical protein
MRGAFSPAPRILRDMSEEPQQEAVAVEAAKVVSPEAPSTKPSAYPFSVLAVLRTAMRVTKRNLVPFLVLSSVIVAPSIIVVRVANVEEAIVVLLLGMVTQSLASAVVTYGVVMELQGSRPSARACIANGFSQLGRVLGVSLIAALAICGAMLLLIVPGVIVALMFYVIIPVTVVERVGIDAAMKRSRELTHGRKGDLWLILMLGAAINIAIELTAKYELGPEAALALRGVGSAFTTMFFSVTSAVVYVTLRRLREGTTVPDLATAFARIRK